MFIHDTNTIIRIQIHHQKGKKVSQIEANPISGEQRYSCAPLIFSKRWWVNLSQHVFHSICPWTRTDGASSCQPLMYVTLAFSVRTQSPPSPCLNLLMPGNLIINSQPGTQSQIFSLPTKKHRSCTCTMVSAALHLVAINRAKEGPGLGKKGSWDQAGMYLKMGGEPSASG